LKSIKPGRGPSMMGGIMSVMVGLFGVLWIVIVAGSGGGLFALAGVIFVIVAVINAVYNFKNATSKTRYSTFDITDENEETDPLHEIYGARNIRAETKSSRYCPYCGAPVESDYRYCNRCGKELPS